MSLVPGGRLGAYDVVSLIGAGGMGEVYKARDSKLGRDVAIKVLPESLNNDAERIARFAREAQILASLNHPNIAHIYGFEERDGASALVMEFVDGETLADRIRRGPIPIDESLAITRQILAALECAHAHGIIHRDLKPANVKLSDNGEVKVLDFGLAKAVENPVSGTSSTGGPVNSATITSPAMTMRGVVLGTAAYMSPEQAKGKSLDRRADMWALGCVMFEALTARRAFEGEDVADTVAAVLTRTPDWSRLPPTVSPPVRSLIERCLERDVQRRVPDPITARWLLDATATSSSGIVSPVRGRVVAAATLVVVAALGFAGGRWSAGFPPTAPAGVLSRTSVTLPNDAPLALGAVIPQVGFDSPAVAISPDGRLAAYIGQNGSGTLVYLRDLSSAVVTPVKGSDAAIYAFFSPDNRTLGFLTDDKVKKVPIEGGTPLTLCDARVPVRAVWRDDDYIFFTQDEGRHLLRVPSGGGRPVAVGPELPLFMKFSDVLPGSGSALATSATRGISNDFGDILLVNLVSGEKKLLTQSGYDGRYVAPGVVLFGRGGSLYAARMNDARDALSEPPVKVFDGVAMESLFGQMHAAVSEHMLALVPGVDRGVGRLAWIDRTGNTEFLNLPPASYGLVDISPDDSQIAVHSGDVVNHVWLYDVARASGRKLAGTDNSGWPRWSTDGRRLAVYPVASDWRQTSTGSSPAAGPFAVPIIHTLDGSLPPRELVAVSANALLTSWSPDDAIVALQLRGTRTALGFFTLGGKLERVGSEQYDLAMPYFSPDGKWVAYHSNSTGRYEVFIRSFPDGKTVRQLSSDGGVEPIWCRCGELFYRIGNRWMSSKIRTAPTLEWDPPRQVFQTEFLDTPGMSYDVTSNGKRLLVVKSPVQEIRNRIDIISNWQSALPQPQ